jgi:hypothetical protein
VSTPHVLPHDDGEHFWWFHDCKTSMPDGQWHAPCRRETMLPLGPDHWSYDPAADTVSPSILCHLCKTHGFWQNGQWRQA